MDILTATITSHRAIDGLVDAANKNGRLVQEFVNDILTEEGLKYARLNMIGVITSSAFIRRFTLEEYTMIIEAAQVNAEIADLVTELEGEPYVDFRDERLEPGLQKLADAGLLLGQYRIAELMAYDRPEPAIP